VKQDSVWYCPTTCSRWLEGLPPEHGIVGVVEPTYAFDYTVIAWFLIVGVAFVIVTLALSRLLQPRKPEKVKGEIYECGVRPVGPSWVQFKIGYYVYALLFVLFDIETAFLYPWAVALNSLPVFVLGEMVIFLVILALGLAYAWKEGALTWR
jgi:NADH:ubiquinone oxidoreductase subunit 3 (subunit A)